MQLNLVYTELQHKFYICEYEQITNIRNTMI